MQLALNAVPYRKDFMDALVTASGGELDVSASLVQCRDSMHTVRTRLWEFFRANECHELP